MKKTNNSTFRQIRVAAFAALAAVACVGGARAATTINYSVGTGIDGAMKTYSTTLPNYKLCSATTQFLQDKTGVPFEILNKPQTKNKLCEELWTYIKAHYWTFRENVLTNETVLGDTGVLDWHISSKLSNDCLWGGKEFGGDKSPELSNDKIRWMILFYNEYDGGTKNGIRLAWVEKCPTSKTIDGSTVEFDYWNGARGSEPKTGSSIASAFQFKPGDHMEFQKATSDDGRTLSPYLVYNYNVEGEGGVTNKNCFYGIDANTVISITWRAADGYVLRDQTTGAYSETYVQEYTVLGTETEVKPANVEAVKQTTNPVTDDKGKPVDVKIPKTWIDENLGGSADNLNIPGANGVTNWQNYVLGMNPTDPYAKPVVTPVQTSVADKLTLAVATEDGPHPDSGMNIEYQLWSHDGAAQYEEKQVVTNVPEFVVDLPTSGVRYFKVTTKCYGNGK